MIHKPRRLHKLFGIYFLEEAVIHARLDPRYLMGDDFWSNYWGWEIWFLSFDGCRIDLDIEGGSQTGYTAFVSTLRGLMAGGSKQWVSLRNRWEVFSIWRSLPGIISQQVNDNKFSRPNRKAWPTRIAPQCPFPDSYFGPTLNQVQFDAVYVQFCRYFFSSFLLADSCAMLQTITGVASITIIT